MWSPIQLLCGWTVDAADELCRRLVRVNRPAQARAIAAVAHGGGFADRVTVLNIGGYTPDRSLNGFTKPVRRLMRDMIADRKIPADAALPLESVYDPNNASFQRTTGFRMPAELAEVFAQVVSAP